MAYDNNIEIDAKGDIVTVRTFNGYELESIELTPEKARNIARELSNAADKADEYSLNQIRKSFLDAGKDLE